ncbi:MAG: polysaccharide biosynthesis C-terminal domain-containing protein [Bacteroidales bacterium]|nr:polysaccharide biosynthesis C-terminal domain-containing protein [Bacteroidales bacterium]
MGVIRRQTIKGAMYSYLGVILGFMITGLLLPHTLTPDENGVIKLIVSYSVLFAQLAGLGFNSVTTRLFTFFRNKQKNHNGFFFIALVITLIGLIVSLILFFILKDSVLEKSGGNENPLLTKYVYYIIPMLLFTALFYMLDNYYKVLFNAIIGTALKEFVQRIFILSSILLFFFNYINFATFVLLYVCCYAVPVILISLFLIYEKEISLKPQLDFISKDLKRSMLSVSFFGIIVGFSNMAILNIDSIMVNQLLNLSSTGIYGITFFFGTLIIIPSRALKKISSAVLADAWKENNLEIIDDIYKKSCLNQFIFGLLLFIGIWANIDNIFEILPKEYEAGKYVIFFIGLTNLIEMFAGVSGAIIVTSKEYRYLTWFMLFLIVLLIITNLIFIPIWGMTGAAIASMVSAFIYVLCRYLLLIFKYKMQPYNLKFIIIVLIGVLVYFIGVAIPRIDNYIIDIVVRSVLMLIIFSLPVYFLKLSPDINSRVEVYWRIVKKKLRS